MAFCFRVSPFEN